MDMFVNARFFLLLPFMGAFVIIWFLAQKKHAIVYSDERLLRAPSWRVIFLWKSAHVCLMIALICAVAALARPLGKMEEVLTYEYMYHGCLVIDISSSMTGVDNPAVSEQTRIQTVVKAAKEFLQKRKGDALCMIPFATEVRLDWTMPVTNDIQAISNALDDLIRRVDGNTAMGDGMFFAFAMLVSNLFKENERINITAMQQEIINEGKHMHAPFPYLTDVLTRINGPLRDTFILVLSDGEHNTGIIDPLPLLTILARFGIRVYILGVGTTLSQDGKLAQLVTHTRGAVLSAGNTADLEHILESINQLEKRKTLTEVIYKPREFAPLVMAISVVFFLIFLFIWIGLRMGSMILQYINLRVDYLKQQSNREESAS